MPKRTFPSETPIPQSPKKNRASVFKSRSPKDLAFPADVKKLIVRRQGNRLVLEREETFQDDFFSRPPCPDFPERALQG